MQGRSDDIYRDVVAPRFIGSADASTYSPHVAPTASLVCGQEGGNSSVAAHTIARAVEGAGGCPVIVDESLLREIHARSPHVEPDQMRGDVQHWATRLLHDAADRRLDLVIASSLTGHDMVDRTVDVATSRGYEIGVVVASTSPGVSKRELVARGGAHGDARSLAAHDEACARLPAAIERLDRHPLVSHIRVVNEHGRTLMRGGPERHAKAHYAAREVLTQDWLGMRERPAPHLARHAPRRGLER